MFLVHRVKWDMLPDDVSSQQKHSSVNVATALPVTLL